MATPEDIERKLTCSICLHVLVEPKLLTCGHTYCLGCLHSHICQAETPQTIDQVLGFLCPLCREFIPAPDSTSPPLAWASKYRTNYIVQDLLEVHRDSRRRKPPCAQHAGRVLELFCRDCNTPVCDRCVSLQHRACAEVVELHTVVKEKQNVTGQQLLHVNAMIAQCDSKRKRCDGGSSALDQIEFEVGQNIERECRDVLQRVTARLMREADRLKLQSRTQCEAGRATVRNYVAKCQELKTVLERMRTYLLRKASDVTIASPPNVEDERRVASTLTKLAKAVDAIDTPCHFEVDFYLDDSALNQALVDLCLGEVTILQISDTVHGMTSQQSLKRAPAKNVQTPTEIANSARSRTGSSSSSTSESSTGSDSPSTPDTSSTTDSVSLNTVSSPPIEPIESSSTPNDDVILARNLSSAPNVSSETEISRIPTTSPSTSSPTCALSTTNMSSTHDSCLCTDTFSNPTVSSTCKNQNGQSMLHQLDELASSKVSNLSQHYAKSLAIGETSFSPNNVQHLHVYTEPIFERSPTPSLPPPRTCRRELGCHGPITRGSLPHSQNDMPQSHEDCDLSPTTSKRSFSPGSLNHGLTSETAVTHHPLEIDSSDSDSVTTDEESR